MADERRKHDKLPAEIQVWIDAAVEKAFSRLEADIKGWIEAAAERGAELGSEKTIIKLLAEVTRSGVRKALLIISGLLAACGAWLGIKPPT